MSESISPLAGTKLGVRLVTDMDLSISQAEANARVNQYMSDFSDEMPGTDIFDYEYSISNQRDQVIFRGIDIAIGIDSFSVVSTMQSVVALVNFIHQKGEIDRESDPVEVDTVGGEGMLDSLSEELEVTATEIDYRDVVSDTVVYTSPTGDIADIERPFMKTSLGISDHNSPEIDFQNDRVISKISRETLPDMRGIRPYDSEVFGVISVLDTGEVQVEGDRIVEVIDAIGNPFGLLFVSMDKGRL